MEPVQFFLAGKPVEAQVPVSVRHLLDLAGMSPDGSYVVVKDGREYNDAEQLVDIAPGEKVEIRPAKPERRVVHYTVNGEEQVTGVNPLSVETILRQAGEASAIDVDDLGSYYLADISDGKKYESLDDLVTLEDGDEFVAVHKGPTPVA